MGVLNWLDRKKENADKRQAKWDARVAENKAARKTNATDDENTVYDVDVSENLAVAGYGSTRGMKYRWVIIRNGEPFKAGYGFTFVGAYNYAKAKAERIHAKRMGAQ